MRMTIERLRVLLVASAAALVLIVGSFLAVAHYRTHRFLRNLPAQLGADIEKETNGYTYSQSGAGGRTIFTIHAAKAVQRRDGKVLLHDVGIVLYGRERQRADRIYGKEFEYDQSAGVVRAAGEVHLDLQAPAPTGAGARAAYAAGQEMHSEREAEADPGLVHVKTSGLVYLQKLGVASTTEEIEFTYHGFSGRALGATYNADTAMTTLEREVQMSGVRDGRPMLLRAGHGEMDQKSGLLTLLDARYTAVGGRSGGGDGRQQVAAGRARVMLRADGTLERVEGSEGVSVESDRGTLRAPRGVVEMNAAGKPATARMMGHVTYQAEQPLDEQTGEAGEMRAHFDTKGQADSATMTGGTELYGRVRRTTAGPWSERELRASTVAIRLGGDGGHRVLREGVADGEAHMVLRETAAKGGVEQSEISGAHLTATFAPSGRTAQVTRVEGAGHTVLDRSTSDGVRDHSAGDSLEVRFTTEPPGQRKGAGGFGEAATPVGFATRVAGAVQRGSVVVRHTAPQKDGTLQTIDGGAREVNYDGASDRLSLVGEAMMRETARTVRADRIELDHGSGDAEAKGHVQVSTAQPGGGSVMHVVGDSATFAHVAGTATFRGGAAGTGLARAWQGGSQVEAATLVFAQKDGTLEAFGAPGTQAVRTVLSEANAGVQREANDDAMSSAAARHTGGVARITSGRLRYSDAERRAEFTGGVQLDDSHGSMHATVATAYLHPAVKNGAQGQAQKNADARSVTPPREGHARETTAVLPAGGLDRVVAMGGVVLRQPGREATGEQVVYTAADSLFTLTGTPAALPQVTDAANGTVHGTTIRFHSGDNSVVVSGDPARGAAGRVRSETRIKTD